jgi:hypothetical protein
MITFDVKVDENIADKNVKILFRLMFKRMIKHLIVAMIGIIFYFIIFLLGNSKSNFDYGLLGFIICLSFFLIGSLLLTFLGIKKVNKTKLKNIEFAHYEINDDSITYSDNIQSHLLKWNIIKSYTVIDETIIIICETIVYALIIRKHDIGEEKFINLIKLLEGKVNKRLG